jgi:hypothetical protein
VPKCWLGMLVAMIARPDPRKRRLHAMTRARLIELALPIVIYLALTLAVFALALWLLPI